MSRKGEVERDNRSGSDEDDDGFGPQPVVTDSQKSEESEQLRKKSRRVRLPNIYELEYLQALPSAMYYEHSFMHRDIVTHICVSKAAEFIMTGSHDGHVKFWKKMPKTIEFVKHFQAHLSHIQDMVLSPDEKLLATVGHDKMIKIFEVIGFDMSNMIELDFFPQVKQQS